jgi:hypothetical protein
MTTTTALPVAWAALEAALRRRRPVWLSYHGKQRLVCPHALGWKSGRPMVLAYQTGGETTSGTLGADPRKRWRCLFVDEVDHVEPREPAGAWDSSDNYAPCHPFPVIDEVAVAVTADGSDGSVR